jgi:hypothetical protein
LLLLLCGSIILTDLLDVSYAMSHQNPNLNSNDFFSLLSLFFV